MGELSFLPLESDAPLRVISAIRLYAVGLAGLTLVMFQCILVQWRTTNVNK